MIGTLVAILTTVADLIEAHPELAKALLAEARQIISHEPETLANPEAVRAMVAGLSAARAQAVQAAQRRVKS